MYSNSIPVTPPPPPVISQETQQRIQDIAEAAIASIVGVTAQAITQIVNDSQLRISQEIQRTTNKE